MKTLGRPAKADKKGLFSTWLKFKSITGDMPEDEIRAWVNTVTGNNYSAVRFHQFQVGVRSLPDVLIQLINEDYTEMLGWLLNQKFTVTQLSEMLKLNIKIKKDKAVRE